MIEHKRNYLHLKSICDNKIQPTHTQHNKASLEKWEFLVNVDGKNKSYFINLKNGENIIYKLEDKENQGTIKNTSWKRVETNGKSYYKYSIELTNEETIEIINHLDGSPWECFILEPTKKNK